MNVPYDSLWLEVPETSEVARFLEGPQPRSQELLRAFRIFWEFVRGFQRMHFIGPCVTVFGSARFGEGHPYYRIAREIGMRLAQAGFAVSHRNAWSRVMAMPARCPAYIALAASWFRRCMPDAPSAGLPLLS